MNTEIPQEENLEIEVEEEEEEEAEGGEGEGEGEGKEKKEDKGKQPDPNETPEQKLARWNRQADRFAKKNKLGKYAEGDQPANGDGKAKKGLDWGQKAYLSAEGVKGADEIALVESVMRESGKDLDGVLASGYFQAELKGLRERREAANAVPSGTKRTGQSSAKDVQFWVDKGELPPDTPENVKLRREVVNARAGKGKSSKTQFSPTPVVGGGK